MDFTPLDKGLDLWHRPETIEAGAATVCLNFALDRERALRTRGGIRRLTQDGTSVFTTDESILGIHQSFTEAGLAIQLIKDSKPSIHLWAFSGTEIVGGGALLSPAQELLLDPDFRPHFVAFNNTVLIFDKSVTFITNGTVTVKVGEDEPPSPTFTFTPKQTSPAGGGLSEGDYLYAFVAYSSALDTRTQVSDIRGSFPSDLLTMVLPNDTFGIAFAGYQLPDDFDILEVYRTAVGGTELFLVDELSQAQVDAGYDDSTFDGALGAIPLASTTTVTPEGARAAGYFQGRIWYAPTDRLTHVRFSEPGETFWPVENLIRVGEQDGDRVNAFHNAGSIFYAIRDHSMFVLRGSDERTYRWDMVEGGIGGQSPHGVTSVSGVIYVFNHEQWIYRFRNAQLQPIGRPIREYVIDKADLTRADTFGCEYEPRSESVWFHLGLDLLLVWFHRTGAWVQYDFPATAMALVVDETTKEQRLLMGTLEGFLWYAEDFDVPLDGVSKIHYDGLVVGLSSQTEFDVTPIYKPDENTGSFLTIRYASGEVEVARILQADDGAAITIEAGTRPTIANGDRIIMGSQRCEWVGGSNHLGDLFNDKRSPGVMSVSLAGDPAPTLEISLTGNRVPKYLASKVLGTRGVVRHTGKGPGLRFTPAMRYQDQFPLSVFGVHVPSEVTKQKHSTA